MDRRIFCFAALAVLVAGAVRAQTLSFAPVNPKPGETVKLKVTADDSCGISLQTSVTPPGPGNGAIRLTLTQGCICITGPIVTLDAEAGPLAFGTYDVQLILESRLNG